jgi:hypothetical protein
LFEVIDSYKGAPEEIPESIKGLSCYKETAIDDSPETERCGCDLDDCQDCFPDLGPIYLNVTDALIMSGLNPYDPEKRERMIEFYASRRNVTQQEYINFNRKYNGDRRKLEQEISDMYVDRSTKIKYIAKNAQFGNFRDEYALEPIVCTLDALGVEVWEEESSFTIIDDRTNQLIKVEVNADKEFILTRADGCIKLGHIDPDTGMIVDEEEEEFDMANVKEEHQGILTSNINKIMGCGSEVNVQEYLKEEFENYEHGQIPVGGVIDGIHYNGLIDGIIRAEYGHGVRTYTDKNGKTQQSPIQPVVKGFRPIAIFEIKKRTKKIFTMDELIERKYDLCQLVLYKILTNQGANGLLRYKPLSL